MFSKAQVAAGTEKLFTVLLAFSFAVPLLLTFWFYLVPDTSPATLWLRNGTLNGLSNVPPIPPLSFAALRSAALQVSVADHVNNAFVGRELIIRLTNEALLRFFRTSSLPMVIGHGPSLILNDARFNFVDEYTILREPPDKLRPLVEDLRRFQDHCLLRGVGFTVVITPTKPSILPEQLPDGWAHRYDPRPRDYDNFLHLLRAEGVRYVDGHALTTDAKRTDPGPVFPPGGIHWDEYAAMTTANGLLADLAAQGQPVRPATGIKTTLAPPTNAEDVDMLRFAALTHLWPYRVAHLDIPPVPLKQSQRPTVVFVGGSFVERLGQVLYRTHQFSEIDWLRYYHEAKEVAVEDGFRVLIVARLAHRPEHRNSCRRLPRA